LNLCGCGYGVGAQVKFCPHCGNRLRDDLCDATLALGAMRIIHLIGEGGFAMVYLAEHREHGTIAVKVLKDEFAANPMVLERWRTEVEANLRFCHPHKPKTWASGEEELRGSDGKRTIHWMAMEYVKGYSLESYLEHLERHHRVLKLDQLVDLMDQVLDVVVAAHDHGVVHRDLHPDNINITVGPAGVVHARVLDFGISRLVDRPVESDLERVGRARWMSPQQAAGEPVDHRTDIYNLGLLLYRMLTGRHPHVNRTTGAFLPPELAPEPVPPSKVKGLPLPVPRRFDRITRKALQIEPKKRHRNARAFRRELAATIRPARSGHRTLWLWVLGLAAAATAAAIWKLPSLRPSWLERIWG
jgi:serine/threonine-protein kinase